MEFNIELAPTFGAAAEAAAVDDDVAGDALFDPRGDICPMDAAITEPVVDEMAWSLLAQSDWDLEALKRSSRRGTSVASRQVLSGRWRVTRGKRMEMPPLPRSSCAAAAPAVWVPARENSAPTISHTGAFCRKNGRENLFSRDLYQHEFGESINGLHTGLVS